MKVKPVTALRVPQESDFGWFPKTFRTTQVFFQVVVGVREINLSHWSPTRILVSLLRVENEIGLSK